MSEPVKKIRELIDTVHFYGYEDTEALCDAAEVLLAGMENLSRAYDGKAWTAQDILKRAADAATGNKAPSLEATKHD